VTVATYTVLGGHVIHKKLKGELKMAFPDENAKLGFVTLGKLPYLVHDLKSYFNR